MPSSSSASLLPSSFIRKILHSLTGVFLVLFLCLHLLTNSQAALFFGADGSGFIHDVNAIHALPYLIAIELFLLGVPFLIHMYYGVIYLWTSTYQTHTGSSTTPYLPYARNRAYMWQRVTAWLLLFAVAAHVVQMRIINYADSVKVGDKVYYLQHVNADEGIYSVAVRLGVQLFTSADIAAAREDRGAASAPLFAYNGYLPASGSVSLDLQRQHQRAVWQHALERWPLTADERIAVATDFGTATLLMVRETFKSVPMAIFYSIFVIAACYHAFNGMWSAAITLGITLSEKTQQRALRLWQGAMLVLILLGLAAIWCTYWITLKT